MRYGSVCSGVEAATMAWHHMGWKPSFFSEIEPFPCAVLQHHYPDVPLHGDFTTIGENDYEPIDLLVGGTPCQSFSIAGLRKGMADERGNLALEFLKLAQRTRPTWVVWENVPGVLSSNGGRDFGAFLGGLGEIGYGFAYRVLDAQYFGVPQRRRRVFVVGYLGDWRPPAAVLFERHSLSGHPAPSREAGEEAARDAGVGTTGDYQSGSSDMIPVAVDAYNGYVSKESHATVSTKIDHNRNLLCFEPRSPDGVPRIHGETCPTLNTMSGGQREPRVAMGIPGNWIGRKPENGGNAVEPMVEYSPCLTSADRHGVAVMHETGQGFWKEDGVAGTLRAEGENRPSRPSHVIMKEHSPCLTSTDRHGVATQQIAYNIAPGKGISKDDIHVTEGSVTKTLDASGSNPAMHQGGSAIVSKTVSLTLDKSKTPAVALCENQRGELRENSVTNALATQGGKPGQGYAAVRVETQVRRLTPVECERLQGFPDDFTKIPYRGKTAENCPDGPRYKAMGNSMAVPVMKWIGERIQGVESISKKDKAC